MTPSRHCAVSLAEIGAPLFCAAATRNSSLAAIAGETDAAALYFSRAYEPWARRQKTRVQALLGRTGLEVKRFAGALLREPEEVRTKAGDPFKVYTPFWRSAYALGPPSTPAACA